MGEAGELLCPVIAVNDASTKWDFDNVHGTGQSTLDGIIRATSVLLAGKTFVVAGYGRCGKGLMNRARGMGANVIVTEVDPIAALKAVMDGYRVMQMDDAAKIGDIFCTATGMKDVIIGRHFDIMKEGAIVCNTGHYDCEINISHLEDRAKKIYTIREDNETFPTQRWPYYTFACSWKTSESSRSRRPSKRSNGYVICQSIPSALSISD